MTGEEIILNTSFNLHGFPIVYTPQHALAPWTIPACSISPAISWCASRASSVCPSAEPDYGASSKKWVDTLLSMDEKSGQQPVRAFDFHSLDQTETYIRRDCSVWYC